MKQYFYILLVFFAVITIVCKPFIEYSQNQIVNFEDLNEEDGKSDSETEDDLPECFDYLVFTSFQFQHLNNIRKNVVIESTTNEKLSKGFPFKYMNPPEL